MRGEELYFKKQEKRSIPVLGIRIRMFLASLDPDPLVRAQSTYKYRAPQYMSPRRNWNSPTPLAASECTLPPGPKGGEAHSPAAKGVGNPNSNDWRKSLALCLLWGTDPDPDPDPDPSLFSYRFWADWNNACKIPGRILTQSFSKKLNFADLNVSLFKL